MIKGTTIQFNDSVLDVSNMSMYDYNQLTRREMVEVMYKTNEVSYNRGYTCGITVGILYSVFVVLAWKFVVNLFSHRVSEALKNKESKKQ